MVCSQEEHLLLKNTLQMSRKWNECTLSDWFVIPGEARVGAAYPPAGPMGCVCCADHSGFIRGFAGTQGGVTTGELPVGPLEAGGEVKEGQHQLRGVAVTLPRGIVPLLERPVVGNDLIERYSKHQGRDLCIRDGRTRGSWKHSLALEMCHFWHWRHPCLKFSSKILPFLKKQTPALAKFVKRMFCQTLSEVSL